ncbi:MAG: anthranilate phosphoribosyltransferase [Methanobacterium sp.]
MMINDCLKKVVSGQDLSEDESYQCMMEIKNGTASDVEIAALLTALSMKGETVDEITGFAKAMREASVKVSPPPGRILVDSCGTGGDKFKTFNVSTAAAIIAASCGVTIAKHGNRSITSKCGGADILESLGVNINCDSEGVERCLELIGLGFMFAPHFHPAMHNVMPIRRVLGIRTIFNILGPLTSPANADFQLLGVFDPSYVELMANVLNKLGVKRALVVHGFDNMDQPAMDEISTLGRNKVALLCEGVVKVQEWYPEDFGLEYSIPEYIKAPESLNENIEVITSVLKGRRNSIDDEARLNLCLVNAAAILFIAGKADSLKMGMKLVRESVINGDAFNKLSEFIRISNKYRK